MENDFKYFLRCLEEASRRMDRHYFQLDVAGSEEKRYRERVYCYELYHHLRCILGDGFPYKLDGEVDKNGHPIIRHILGPKKPDFIVHVPGVMERNLLVVEVKPITVSNRMSDLTKDLKKLKGFLDEANYQYAIMLIYGNGGVDLPQEIVAKIDDFPDDRILLVWHRGPGKKSNVVPG